MRFLERSTQALNERDSIFFNERFTARERWHLDECAGRVIDLGQSGKPISGDPGEDLFTLLHGMGLVWHDEWKRPYTAPELFASQGNGL